ncbi:MAG: 3-phosphoshikimate 1-carboxyvinyltransferase [Ruminiclostridium sp.]|nr:3-phosphoshikimate 1-carboxyvinyltransferase [Ruminiclostridium sp.]
MNLKITPKLLEGDIAVPPSKSISHRALIAAALADGESRITNVLDCEDTRATEDALTALGADICHEGDVTVVKGIKAAAEKADINCRESGSTLRFMIPIAAALGTKSTFRGEANLPNRPITPYLEELPRHGIEIISEKMPYVLSGKLDGGDFPVTGDISSQFITGYMLALPLTGEKCTISLTSQLQSRPYAILTADAMKSFGVDVKIDEDSFEIPAKSKFSFCDYTVEADMSQAAFFLVGDAIGGNINPVNLRYDSVQGDRAIIDIVKQFNESGGHAFDVNAEDIPDLVPILTVLACFAEGTSHITGCGRLRIKESDRLAAISTELNRLGAKVEAGEDYLTIHGVESLHGGECETYSDHRIAMSLAIASQRCTEAVTIKGAECVSKSYPTFFEDFRKLGGVADVI